MAIVQLITTHGAVPADGRARLSIELAKLTNEAEGFAGSSRAPALCWTFFEEQPRDAFSTGARSGGAPLLRHYHHARHRAALEERSRVWVRFIDVADGDLIVGGESTSLAGLRALIRKSS